MANLTVIRPPGGNETAQAWRVALKRRDGPTALILTRQALVPVALADNKLERGASAPYKVLFEQFGFSVDNVVKQAHTLVA